MSSSSSGAAFSLAVRPLTSIYPKLWFKSIPEPARFMTSAGIGNIIFFYIDVILYDLVIYPLSISDYDTQNANNIVTKTLQSVLPPKRVLQRNRESISFFISYLIQIVAQHLLNAFFVYGLDTISTKDKYLATLAVTYSSYFISLVGSTFCNVFLLRQGMTKNLAFWGTVFGFGCFNFLLLRTLIRSTKQEDDVATNGNKRQKNHNQSANSSTSNKSNIRAEKKKTVKNNSFADRRKLRGGAITKQHDFCYFILKMISELNSIFASHIDPQMAFVKSIELGINNK